MKRHLVSTLFTLGLSMSGAHVLAAGASDIGPLPPVKENPENKLTPERLELGRALFFDNRISASGSMNCATCHLPHQGWTVHTPISPANPGHIERRNAPTLINVGYNEKLIWDGRAWPLEKQAIGSTKNPLHKGQDIDKLMRIFNDDPKMVAMFKAAYDAQPNPKDYGRALAVFQRHFIVTGESPFDKFMKSDKKALSASAQRGMALFKDKTKANCVACHNGPNFTDSDFHNIGLKRNALFDQQAYREVLKFDAKRTGVKEWEGIDDDPGRYTITKNKDDWKKFKTPTLRNLADTGPYMHDGRYASLDEIIEHYNRGGDKTPNQDPRIKPLNLSKEEKEDLKAFLLALEGPLPEINMADWVRPADMAKTDMLDGKALFEGKATCVNCHQPTGLGIPGVFPPLSGNPHVTEGDGSYVAKTAIHGRSGSLQVKGNTYNATMPPIGTQQGLSDEEIAAVVNYVRNAWGNKADPITAEQVKAQR